MPAPCHIFEHRACTCEQEDSKVFLNVFGCIRSWSWHTGLVAPGMWALSSPTRDWASIPCVGRQILYPWTTWEVLNKKTLYVFFYKHVLEYKKVDAQGNWSTGSTKDIKIFNSNWLTVQDEESFTWLNRCHPTKSTVKWISVRNNLFPSTAITKLETFPLGGTNVGLWL